MLRWAATIAWAALQCAAHNTAAIRHQARALAPCSHATASSLLLYTLTQWRGYKKQANEIRAGNVLQLQGKLYVVTKAAYTQGHGRQLGNVTLDLKEVQGSGRTIERKRPYDTMEAVTLDTQACQVLYRQGHVVHLMQQDTFEQFELPETMWGDAAKYLVDELVVDVNFFEGQAVSVDMPVHVTVSITDTAPTIKGETASGSYKPAQVTGDVQIKVPPYITVGEQVVVDTRTGEFVRRA